MAFLKNNKSENTLSLIHIRNLPEPLWAWGKKQETSSFLIISKDF